MIAASAIAAAADCGLAVSSPPALDTCEGMYIMINGLDISCGTSDDDDDSRRRRLQSPTAPTPLPRLPRLPPLPQMPQLPPLPQLPQLPSLQERALHTGGHRQLTTLIDDDAKIKLDSKGSITNCTAGLAMNGGVCSQDMFVNCGLAECAPLGWFMAACPVTCGKSPASPSGTPSPSSGPTPTAGRGGGGQVAGDCQQGTELVCVMFYGQDANTAFSCPEADGFTLRDSVQPQVQADHNPNPNPRPNPNPNPNPNPYPCP